MSLQAKSMYVAMELSNKNWKLAFGDGARVRERNVPARDESRLLQEVERAKEKLGLDKDIPVVFCYEAGRDGFWIARMLEGHGFKVYVMDPASIEVPRRSRQRKTDRLDARRLLDLLIRFDLWGQRKAFSVVCIPSSEQEAQMRTHRERERLVNERRQHQSRMRSLFALHGVGARISNPAKARIETLRDWAGQPLQKPLAEELKREQKRLCMVVEQIQKLESEQEAALAEANTAALQKARKLGLLKSVGLQSSWLMGQECFGWRTFQNRKRLGSFVGLTGTPFDSGETLREQGISKAGSRRVRTTMIELAWGWVRWQPNSTLTKWFVDRYVRNGTKRSKRKGIVALARKLLIALWKYVEQDVIPEGAILKA
jgi:transposase